MERSSGVFMHISSLPGPYGIGSMGKYARKFADFLAEAKQSYWQILPLVPTGFGDSPYQSCCGAAGNPYFIDLETLVSEELLCYEDINGQDFGQSLDYVDFAKQYENRFSVLKKAYINGKNGLKKELAAFERENSRWLDDYALFMACKEHFNMAALKDWPDENLRRRDKKTLKKYADELGETIGFYKFIQYLFFTQWKELKKYINSKGIKVIGDIPIYVSDDSCEVWTSPELFYTDGKGKLKGIAGVPPDAFSDKGQLWGNPLYDWDYHAKTGFEWWIWRIKHATQFFDVLRIDHFRGFDTYWEIPAGADDAIKGKWRKGPGMDFVKAVKKALPKTEILAEDLGDLDDKVRTFFKKSGLPGMAVLVHAFNPNDDSTYLPHNIKPGTVAYTSNHDSETIVEWFTDRAGTEERQFAAKYLRVRPDEGLGWSAIKSVWASPANIVITTMQDMLCLSGDARMNRPATFGGRNWCWRVREEAVNPDVAGLLRDVTETYRRTVSN